MSAPFVVRRVVPADLPAVARLAGQLVHYHHALDSRRFFLIDRVEEGYAWFLGRELANQDAVVLCAVRASTGGIVGYSYGTLEERDWNMLLDPHGALHDVLVDESARRAGVGELLVRATCGELRARGAPRVVLYTAVQNTQAQALFSKAGFRETMIEMVREEG